MRVLLALQGYPPETRGGIEAAVEALTLSLRELGHEAAVFCGRPVGAGREEGQEALRREVVQGVPVFRYRRLGRRDDPADEHDPRAAEIFSDLLEEWRPEVLHLHHWHRLSNDLITVAARAGVPAVVTLQDLWTNCSWFFRRPGAQGICAQQESPEACGPCTAELRPMEAGTFARSLAHRRETIRQELRLARVITYASESHRRILEEFGPFDDPRIAALTRRLPLGVVDEFLPARRPRDRAEDEPLVVAHWGNLSALKGLEVLARAAARAAERAPIELRLLGREVEDGLVDRLRELAAPANLRHEGAYDRQSLPEHLDGVDLAAFPTLAAETHAIVVDEALALGLPLLVSDGGATAERVGGRGLVVPAGDEAAWAAALDDLRPTEAREKLLSSEIGEVSDRMGWARSLLTAYDEAIALGPPSRSEAPDRSRRRLAASDDALLDVEWFVDHLQQRYALARRALAGDEAARDELNRVDPL
jgi:glycosyltransferase involved in cell wall biosynthesis